MYLFFLYLASKDIKGSVGLTDATARWGTISPEPAPSRLLPAGLANPMPSAGLRNHASHEARALSWCIRRAVLSCAGSSIAWNLDSWSSDCSHRQSRQHQFGSVHSQVHLSYPHCFKSFQIAGKFGIQHVANSLLDCLPYNTMIQSNPGVVSLQRRTWTDTRGLDN